MAIWKKVKLSKLINIKHGFAFKGEYFCDTPTNNILLTPGNFSVGGGFKSLKLKYYDGPIPNNYVLNKGDLIVTMTDLSKQGDTLGYPALIPDSPDYKYLHNQRIGLVEKISNDVDIKYLFYLLRTHIYQKFIVGSASGATVKHTSPGRICNYETDIPDLPTQTNIASVLSAYDDLIENNEKRIKALEEMAQLLYTEWFAKFKFPGHEKVKMVESGTEYGLIPEGWEVGIVRDVANVVSGFPFKGSTYQESGKYKIVTIKNVHDGKFVLNFDSFIDELPAKLPANCILKSGDILLSLTGNVGRICVVYGTDHVLNQRVAKLEPVNQTYREFIYSLFRQRRFQQKLEAMSNGAAQQNLSPIQVKDIKIIVPKLEILDEFSQICGKYFNMSLCLQEKNQNLSKTRDLLIPQLVTGRRELK